MKNYFLYIIGLFLILTSCTQVRTASSGIDNQGFLEFVYTNHKNDYSNGVIVTINENEPFKALVHKDKAKKSAGNVYAVSTGTHIITVTHNGQVIYKKQVFISSQQTVKIKLP